MPRAGNRVSISATTGDLDGARAAFAESKKLLAGPTIEYFDATYPVTNAEDREVFVDDLRKADWEG